MLGTAMRMAFGQTELTLPDLADELAWKTARLRELLNMPDTRPTLTLVPNIGHQDRPEIEHYFDDAESAAEGF